MTAVEITLIIIGIIFLIGSFFVQEKFSQKDIEQISKMSEEELAHVVEKQLKNANNRVEEAIEEIVESSMASTKRSMEKTSNEKIMAINEYSDTVLESMNKTHNEIMFLYSMLNDKHTELTNLAGELQRFSDNMKETENEVLQKLAEAAEDVEQKVNTTKLVNEDDVLVASIDTKNAEDMEETNQNDTILLLHKEGLSDVEIAKQLGRGLGEVKLVIGLFKGEEKIET